MTKHEVKMALCNSIVETLRAYPDLVPATIEALMEGARAANETMSRGWGRAEHATMCALTLADPKRLHADTKALMNEKLCEYLKTIKGRAPLEQVALERYSKEPEEDNN